MPTKSKADDYNLTQDDFQAIAKFAYENFGLSLQESKKPLVYSRLSRRLRILGLQNFQAYRNVLADPKNDQERLELLSALTTNVTHFFREMHHFEKLQKTVLPPLIESALAGNRVRLWSAACSTGQEPYSIAMSILDICPGAAELDIKVLGTDIDPLVVKKAQLAQYTREELDPVPAHMKNEFVSFGSETSNTGTLTSVTKSLVKFGVLNLIKPLPFAGPLDVIFCRNVAIYFDKATQGRVWQTFSGVQQKGGYLFVGHSERLSGPAEREYQSAGITTYVKS